MAAGIKISQLPANLSALLTDYFPVVQGGITSSETLQQVMTLFQANITNLSGLTGSLQAPTFIGDALGNKNLSFSYIANAVNYITLSNSATGIAPSLTANGSDTNIGLQISGKGNGGIAINSPSGNSPLFLRPNSNSNSFLGIFSIPTITGNRTYTLQDGSGTLAFTSGLPSFPLSLSNGGTNASLTASNGGIVWSNATQLQILSGTATANQVLLSGSSVTPAWSTATYPPTTTINQILYSSSANVISGIATANSSMLVTSSTGVPSWSASLTNGQLMIGSTGATPTPSTLTAGTGISIANGAGTITISSNGAAPWIDQTTTPITMSTNTGYTSDAGATLITFTLPTSSSIGDYIEINGKGSGLWTIAQAAGQQINFGNLSTTLGASGSLSSTLQFDNVRLRCLTANTIWTVVSVQGNITVV